MSGKRLTLLLILALCACLASGCGAKAPSAPPAATKAPLALREAVLKAAPDAEKLTELTGDDLSDLLGIEAADCSEFVFLQGAGLDGREILVLRAADDSRVSQLKDRTEAYLDQRRKETRNYLPEAYQLLEQASVATKGLTVALFVGPDAARETDTLLAGE